MTDLTIYHYDPETYEYVRYSLGRIDPREHVLSVPAFATTVKPFTTKKNQTQIFNHETEKWTIVSDFRNTEYWLSDESYHIITEIDVEPPANVNLTPPISIKLNEKIIELNQCATKIITKKWPIHKQLNAGLGLLTSLDITQLKQDIQTVTTAHNTNKAVLHKLYDSNCTVADLNNIVIDWPII